MIRTISILDRDYRTEDKTNVWFCASKTRLTDKKLQKLPDTNRTGIEITRTLGLDKKRRDRDWMDGSGNKKMQGERFFDQARNEQSFTG